jgi:PilZ domain
MTTPPVRVERRVGQRFPYLLPVSLRHASDAVQSRGFTQDLSSRGVFLFTDASLTEGGEIELTLRMPSEITLGEDMPVCCRGHILRVVRPAASRAAGDHAAETKIGIAVRFDGYEYLPDSESANAARIAALHSEREEEWPLAVHVNGR